METFRIALEEQETARPFSVFANGVNCVDLDNLANEVAEYVTDYCALQERLKTKSLKVGQSSQLKKRKAVKLTVVFEDDGTQVGATIQEFGHFVATSSKEDIAEVISELLKFSQKFGHVWSK